MPEIQGRYELWGGVLDSSYCYADGPDDYYPDADDGWLPEFDSFDNLEEQDDRDYDDEKNIDDREDPINSENDDPDYDVDAAVQFLRENANQTPQGYCARAVRQALEAGGLSTDNRPAAATDYDDYLPTLGFIQVDIANYVPQIGDIVVHEALEGHPYGHIAMFDGNDWISDFIQRDMFGGNAYRENQDYTIWRRN